MDDTRSEGNLQDALYRYFSKKNHPLTVPNCGADCVMGEADLISVTRAKYVHEVEIKRSRTDFNRDFRQKEGKHQALKQGYQRRKEWYSQPDELLVYANYFWFACPEGVLDESDMPEYAGLMVVKDNARVVNTIYHEEYVLPPSVRVRKSAPRLNTDKIGDDAYDYLARGLNARYWDKRTENAYWQDLESEPAPSE